MARATHGSFVNSSLGLANPSGRNRSLYFPFESDVPTSPWNVSGSNHRSRSKSVGTLIFPAPRIIRLRGGIGLHMRKPLWRALSCQRDASACHTDCGIAGSRGAGYRRRCFPAYGRDASRSARPSIRLLDEARHLRLRIFHRDQGRNAQCIRNDFQSAREHAAR